MIQSRMRDTRPPSGDAHKMNFSLKDFEFLQNLYKVLKSDVLQRDGDLLRGITFPRPSA